MASSSNKFPVKLYNILQEAEKTPYLAEIVSWSSDGKSFRVHRKDEFSNAILPATFGTNVYKSFQRNLHFWGYQNIRKGPSKGVCSHPYFLRDRPELLAKMRRIRAPSKTNEQDNRSNEDRQMSEDSCQMEKVDITTRVSTSGSSHRVISPSMSPPAPRAESNVDHSNPNIQVITPRNTDHFLGGNPVNTAALLLILQQQHQNNEAEQQQQQQAIAESLLVQHLLAKQEQQQQEIQGFLAATIRQGQQSTAPPFDFDQNPLMRAIVSQLFQRPVVQSSPSSNPLQKFLR